MSIHRNENACLLIKCTSRDLLRLHGQRGLSINTNRCHVLYSSSLLLVGPGELGSAGRSLRQVRLLIEYSKDLMMAPLQGPVLLCGCDRSL